MKSEHQLDCSCCYSEFLIFVMLFLVCLQLALCTGSFTFRISFISARFAHQLTKLPKGTISFF